LGAHALVFGVALLVLAFTAGSAGQAPPSLHGANSRLRLAGPSVSV